MAHNITECGIDFNDDYQFTNDELIVDNPVLANNQGAGDYSEPCRCRFLKMF